MSCVLLAVEAGAQQNRIDTITPMALDLAGYGSYQIGVRTLQVTDRNRPDVLSTRDGSRGATFPFVHYADAVWNTVRMDNILDHFATAYFDLYVKGESDKKAYFDTTGSLKGFKPRTAVGLTLEHLEPTR